MCILETDSEILYSLMTKCGMAKNDNKSLLKVFKCSGPHRPPQQRGKYTIQLHRQNNIDIYREISLHSLSSNCYTSVLGKRLAWWAEENDKLSDAQAGFRQGHSTTSHIFTLSVTVEKSPLESSVCVKCTA